VDSYKVISTIRGVLAKTRYGKDKFTGQTNMIVPLCYFMEFIEEMVKRHLNLIESEVISIPNLLEIIADECTEVPATGYIRTFTKSAEWKIIGSSPRMFTKALAHKIIDQYTVANYAEVLLGTLSRNQSSPNVLAQRLELMVDFSEIIAETFNVTSIPRDSMTREFINALPKPLARKVVEKRIQTNMGTTTRDHFHWHVTQASILAAVKNYFSPREVPTRSKRSLKELSAQPAREESSEQPTEESEEASSDYEAPPSPEHGKASLALANAKGKRPDKRSPSKPGKRKLSAMGPSDTPQPKAKRPNLTDQMNDWLKAGRCLICGAPGKDQGGHWARDCPDKHKAPMRGALKCSACLMRAQGGDFEGKAAELEDMLGDSEEEQEN
jgi:hypothetical protein